MLLSEIIRFSFHPQVLNIAVLVILITAPLGAAAIMLSAPRLLSKSDQTQRESLGSQDKTIEA